VQCLILADHQPTVAQMPAIHRGLHRRLPGVKKVAGGKYVFEARVFADPIVVAQGLAAELIH
jgi:hypothetical protein